MPTDYLKRKTGKLEPWSWVDRKLGVRRGDCLDTVKHNKLYRCRYPTLDPARE